MRKIIHLLYVIKALFFRAIVFFPFECFGYLNLCGAHFKGRIKRIAFQSYNPQTAQVFLPVIKTKKLIIPHGAGLLSRWIVKNPLRKTVSDFDAYLLCGDLDLLQVKDRFNGKTRLYSVGFPFVDTLFHDSNRSGQPDREAAAKGHKKIVLYAPSWGHTYTYGDILSRNIMEVLRCLRKKEVFVLLKLHAASYIPAQAKGILWRRKINQYLDRGRVQLITELDDRPFFKAADILITDISSRSFNFMITGKPLIIHGVPDHYAENEIENLRMKKIYEGAYRADTPRELSSLLDRCLQNPDEMALKRQQVVKEVFTNPGCAAAKAAQTIMQLVN